MFGLEVANNRSASHLAAAAAYLPQGWRSRCRNLMGGCRRKCRGESDDTIWWKQHWWLVVMCVAAAAAGGGGADCSKTLAGKTFIFHYFLNVPCVFSSAWVILFVMYFAPRAPVFIIIMLSWQGEGNIVWQRSTREQRRRRTHLTVQKPNGMVCLLPLWTSDKVDSLHLRCLRFPGTEVTSQQVINTRYWYDFIGRCKSFHALFVISQAHFLVWTKLINSVINVNVQRGYQPEMVISCITILTMCVL